MTAVLLGTVVFLSLSGIPHKASADTVAVLQKKPAVQVVSVPSQNPTTIPTVFRFTRDLQTGSRGADVRYLQILLNRDTDTTVTKSGEETGYFGAKTKSSIVKFQSKYFSEILSPAGRKKGTGIVGSFTRVKLNNLLSATVNASEPLSSTQSTTTATSTPLVLASTSPQTFATGTTTPEEPILPFNEINIKTREALVNILCTTKRGGVFEPLSGSGVIIDPHGVILTNAHIGQYLLLKDLYVPNFIDCLVRAGAPATARYRAKLLYLSPLWVEKNFKKITEDEPAGTGKNDFALLLITESARPDIFPLPTAFPYLPIDTSDTIIARAGTVLIASYPAGFISGISIQKDLFPASSIVTRGQVFNFGGDSTLPDLFSIGASPLAQEGSSGGAVVNPFGKLIGILTTSSAGATTGERDLRAITLNHISRSFKEHTGDDFSKLLEGNFSKSAENFNRTIAPTLKKLFEDELSKD